MSVVPTIEAGVMGFLVPLSPLVDGRVTRAVVDTHLHLPDMFEVWFEDNDGQVIGDSFVEIGWEIKIFGGGDDSMEAEELIYGEITSIEAVCEDFTIYTVLRGYEKSHRLQRAKRTRTFVDMTDGDIARQVAREASLDIGTIEDTPITHAHISQVAQTDWDFLKWRAVEIGFEVGMAEGEFYFRRASGSTAGGGLGGAIAAAADALGLGPTPQLTFRDNLREFRPRLASAGLVPEVEVRVWDPKDAKVVIGKHDGETGSAELEYTPADLADTFSSPFSIPSLPSIPGLPDLGLPSSPNAKVTVNRPVGWGPNASRAADEVAIGMAEHATSTFAEAEGLADGHAGIQAGKKVDIDGVPLEFEGTWVVTQAQHTFEILDEGYMTRFWVSGRNDRSLLGLASIGGTQAQAPSINGFVCGLVTNVNDDQKMGRVKASVPVLDSTYETDWARVVQIGAGAKQGGMFLPEVGDEVLIGFEHGDLRRPYVMGGLINGNSEVDMGGDAVKAMGPVAEVVKRGFASKLGHKIVFDDDELGRTSGITIGTKDDKIQVMIDAANGTITIKCDNPGPPGEINIEAPAQGSKINLKSGGDVTVEAGPSGALTMKGGAGGVKIDAGAGMVEVKGTQIKLN